MPDSAQSQHTSPAGPQALGYGTFDGAMTFVRDETESGVTFTARSHALKWALPIAGVVAALLLPSALALLIAARNQPSAYYAMKPLCGAVTCVIFLVLLVLICRRLWQRRNVPICISIVDGQLITIFPDRSVMRREYPLADLSEVVVKPLGRTISMKRVADLSIRSRQGEIQLLLHGYPLADVNAIARELRARLAIIRSDV